jgi:alpha-L-fucosidase 2
VDAIKAVLEQRGDGGTGFSRAWKMALWARLYDGERANRIFKGYIKEQCYPQLFAKCYTPLQVDGSLGTAAGITEMLMQSHEGVIHLLPALPEEWRSGSFRGVCARGGFELEISWKDGEISRVDVLSKAGQTCRIKIKDLGRKNKDFLFKTKDKRVKVKEVGEGVIEFDTQPGIHYLITTQQPGD